MKLRSLREATSGGVVEIGHVSEDDWELADKIEYIFKTAHIRPDRDKEPGFVAFLDGEPVGATYHQWSWDNDSEAYVYSFDVAVLPSARGGGRPHAGLGGSGQDESVGIRLIRASLDEYESSKHAHDRTAVSLYVVNPKLARLLERRFGFKVEAEYRNGSVHMIRY